MWGRGLLGALLITGGLAVVPAAAEGPQLIYPGGASYPRVIQLEHSGAANGHVMASVGTPDGKGVILESADGGASFAQVGTITDPEGANGRGLCCGTLFELPSQVGAMPAGTLLWAASAGYKVAAGQRHTKQRLWASLDRGRTWTFKSDIATSPNQYNGWEPDLSVSADGHLVANWSDESDKPAHDQKLVQARSSDGVSWVDQRDTVINSDFYVRPGMAGVRRLNDGTYLMVYEVCNTSEPMCAAHFRTSPDGWDYGDPSDLGTTIRTADGKYARHTPTVDVGPGGQLVFVAEMLVNADGSKAPGNGTTLLVNDGDGGGPWREIAAPVPVPAPDNEGCRNFSPSVVAFENTVLEVSPEMVDGACHVLYATGPIPPAG